MLFKRNQIAVKTKMFTILTSNENVVIRPKIAILKHRILYGPVHTNPFSNENGAVLVRFQKDLHAHLSFSYRFRPSSLQRRICFENALIPSVRMLKSTRPMRITIYRPAKLARN